MGSSASMEKEVPAAGVAAATAGGGGFAGRCSGHILLGGLRRKRLHLGRHGGVVAVVVGGAGGVDGVVVVGVGVVGLSKGVVVDALFVEGDFLA